MRFFAIVGSAVGLLWSVSGVAWLFGLVTGLMGAACLAAVWMILDNTPDPTETGSEQQRKG